MTDNVIPFPTKQKDNVPEMLRSLAELLENGFTPEPREVGDSAEAGWPRGLYKSRHFAWVNRDLNGNVAVGFCGANPNPKDCINLMLVGLSELNEVINGDPEIATED